MSGLLIGTVTDWDGVKKMIAALQTWVGRQEGVNQALESATGGMIAIPIGGIIAWPFDEIPEGWLICNGQAVSRTTYARLWEKSKGRYGIGDGVLTFNVPNIKQRTILGVADSGTGSILGGTGGAIDHTHTLSGNTATEAAHTHGPGSFEVSIDVDAVAAGAGGVGFGGVVPDPVTPDVIGTSAAGSAHSHGPGTLAVDGSATGNFPFTAMHWIIRT